MPRLIISSATPGGAERTVDLAADMVSIGREPGNTVVLEGESKASRRHCQLVPLAGEGWEVVDLKSTNGTRVNGSPTERRRLRHGDVVEVGLTRLRFEDEKAAAEAAATGEACYLEWTTGPHKGEHVPLTEARTTFGRRPGNTVVLEDKMASGHHCEVVRDLNGFTVRDLGSTNGTLVNGAPVTETGLTHGMRVRIGNARFVFKDPSMADVEVALEGAEEEEAGWGMMAEVDVAQARGGAGGVVAAVALLLVLAGAAYFVANRPSAQRPEDTEVRSLVADSGFDSGEVLTWTVDEGSPAVAERSATGRPGGGAALLVRHDGKGSGTGVARYAEDLEISAAGAYRLTAWTRRDGGGLADLAMQWVRFGNVSSGSTAVTQTVPVGTREKTGVWSRVTRTVRRPPWADAGRLVVVVHPDSSMRLDDVRFEPTEAPASGGKFDAGGEAEAYLAATGDVALARTATVLFVGGTPWAKMKDGRVVGGPARFEADAVPVPTADGAEVSGRLLDGQGPVPVSLRWSRTPEGLVAKVTVEGAEAVGLCADVPVAHLEDGIGVLGSFGSRRLAPQAGAPLDGVRRVLMGDSRRSAEANRPPTLIALALPAGAGGGTFATLESDDAGLLRVVLSHAGSTADVQVITSFEGERARARTALREAMALLDRSAGEGIERLRQVAAEFPFEEDVRKEALAQATQREEQARTDEHALSEALARFDVLGDAESLAAAEKVSESLARQFPTASAGGSPLEQQVRDDAAKVRAARALFEVRRAGPDVRRLWKVAQMLEQEPGYEAIAALYYDTIVRRGAGLEGAPAGAAGSPEAETFQRIQESRQRRDALLAKPEVRAAYPNLPE